MSRAKYCTRTLPAAAASILVATLAVGKADALVAPRTVTGARPFQSTPSSLSVSYQNHFGIKTSTLFMVLKPSKEGVKDDHASRAVKESSSISGSFDPLNFTLHSDPDIIVLDDTTSDTLNTSEDELEDGTAKMSLWAARALLLVVAILWGTNFASVKYLENVCFHPPCHHPPSEAALARFGVAGLVSLPFLINQRKDIILAGLECGLWITLGYFTQALALSTVDSGKCAFICSLTVVVVPLVSSLVFGKKIKPVNIASGVVALAGIGVLEGLVDTHSILPAFADTSNALTLSVPGMAAHTSNMIANTASDVAADASGWFSSISAMFRNLGLGTGDLLAIGQPIGFGIGFMRIEHYVEKFKDVENRVMTISAAQCMIVGLMSLLWVLFDFHGSVPNMSYMLEPHRLGAIAWTGIMTTVVAIYIEGFALQVASATDAALTFTSEPVWAALFGSWLLHEQLSLNSWIGGAIILGACMLSAVADMGGKKAANNKNSLQKAKQKV